MKFKPVTIYIGLFIIALILIVVFTVKEDTVKADTDPHSGLPSDDIHSKMSETKGEGPSKENVSEKFYAKVDELRLKLEQNPSDTAAMKELGNMMYMSHKTEEALQYYNKILAVDKHRTDIQLSVGIVYYNNKEFDKAESIMEYILSYDKDNTVVFYNQGAISQARGNNKKAKEIWQSLADKYPTTHEAFLARTALKKMEEGK